MAAVAVAPGVRGNCSLCSSSFCDSDGYTLSDDGIRGRGREREGPVDITVWSLFLRVIQRGRDFGLEY